MSKILLLLLSMCLFQRLVLAQEVVSPTYSSAMKKIDKKIEIISNVPNALLLGYVPAGSSNDRKSLKPSTDINTWLQQFIYKQFDTSTDAKAKKLLWVIQHISLGRDSLQRDSYSFVKLKADIYDNTRQNNEQYEWINTFDSTWIVSNKTADFGGLVAIAFDELYKHSIEIKNSKSTTRFQQSAEKFTGTKQEIISKLNLFTDLPIIKDTAYHDGIYTTFNEFKNNAPAITRFYATIDDRSKAVKMYQLMPDSTSKLIEQVWGVSVNNELYFYNAGQMYPIEKSGNGFYLAKYLEPSTRRNQAIYWRKYIGKWQGDDNPYNNAHVLKRSADKDIAIEATHLDFDMEDFTY